jgi:hypothetical protein
MKIGYSVEGSTDRALLRGLSERWCPGAELIEGTFRGTSGVSQRREIPNTCVELNTKGVDVVIFLRDANNEKWADVLKADKDRCPQPYEHLAVFGVCDRNVECWFCNDRDWIANKTGRSAAEFNLADPKDIFESALRITGLDKKEEEIAALAKEAPLHNWLGNRSFEHFYDQLRGISQRLQCRIDNLRESGKSD